MKTCSAFGCNKPPRPSKGNKPTKYCSEKCRRIVYKGQKSEVEFSQCWFCTTSFVQKGSVPCCGSSVCRSAWWEHQGVLVG